MGIWWFRRNIYFFLKLLGTIHNMHYTYFCWWFPNHFDTIIYSFFLYIQDSAADERAEAQDKHFDRNSLPRDYGEFLLRWNFYHAWWLCEHSIDVISMFQLVSYMYSIICIFILVLDLIYSRWRQWLLFIVCQMCGVKLDDI